MGKTAITVKDIIGKSKSMQLLGSMIGRLSKTKTSVLITGESGTGKELVARAIHFSGEMNDKPFVAVNCGAIPETLIESELFGHKRGSFTGAVNEKDGLFKVADGGTIFLDEIGELPLSMQVKLLRVLQDKMIRPVGGNDSIKVDVRVIAATNRELEKEILKGKFREDLYYRLNVINLRMPPLRERKDDIEDLVNYFLRKSAMNANKDIMKVSEAAMSAILHYDFPGNVRELENIIERAVALESESEITLTCLPATVQEKAKKSALQLPSVAVQGLAHLWKDAVKELDKGSVNLDQIINDLEKEFINRALEKTGGVKKKAALLLGVTFRSMRYRIEKLGIEDFEGDTSDPET